MLKCSGFLNVLRGWSVSRCWIFAFWRVWTSLSRMFWKRVMRIWCCLKFINWFLCRMYLLFYWRWMGFRSSARIVLIIFWRRCCVWFVSVFERKVRVFNSFRSSFVVWVLRLLSKLLIIWLSRVTFIVLWMGSILNLLIEVARRVFMFWRFLFLVVSLICWFFGSRFF